MKRNILSEVETIFKKLWISLWIIKIGTKESVFLLSSYIKRGVLGAGVLFQIIHLILDSSVSKIFID